MKLKLTLAVPQGGQRDITLACDVTATVGDAARALIRAGAGGDPRLAEAAGHRRIPVTLRGRAGSAESVRLFDPMSPVATSGLQSGWIVEAVSEFGSRGDERRVVEIAGYIEVLSGVHAGAIYSLVAGENTIGREQSCRVYLSDSSVSRRHAVIEIDERAGVVVRDLDSANGIVLGIDGQGSSMNELRVVRPTELTLGNVSIRITPGPQAEAPQNLSHRVMHTRAPRVAPVFPTSSRELPTPPQPATPSRIPMLAMLAPMMMGGVMYAVTQSPMSLMMVAFSPLMMIGSWVDGTLGGKRKQRRDLAKFVDSLAADRAELTELRAREIAVRALETPAITEVAEAVQARNGLLWTRRPEHRSFLEVRFGDGVLPSRTELTLPARGDTERAQWDELQNVKGEFSEVAPVPLLERFDRCGSLGVVGESLWAESMARSLVMQLVGLHSPSELALACFASAAHTDEWEWLKWLPHVDSVTSPIPAWQLADDAASSTRLITALEGMLEQRRGAAARRSVRSHLDAETRNDDAQGVAVDDLPMIPAVVVLVLDPGLVEASRLIALAEDGPDCGIHLIWVAREIDDLPAACRTFVELESAVGRVSFVRTGSEVQLQRLEPVASAQALELARRLAPVEDTSARVLDESDLPRSVNLRELHGTDLLGGGQPIVRAWSESGSLTAHWSAGAEREPISLAAVVGQSPEGPAAIDLRVHGPHALVGGTTGAGKSEFLQSWIMSMAAKVSPDRLTFLLVDYKGGAAFAECVDLPHTVGLVTDLSPHLVRRALTSLRAELRYREELLAAHGAKDLIAMERRSDAAAPPVLVIVIDEFAALANDVPEFVDGVIDVAQRGRSLGLHLVMATQRPAGVITDNLRANTNLRVALRMADESDSSDVLGVKDAAFFAAETPGRGAFKIGPGRIGHFQTGYLGGRATQSDAAAPIEVRSLGFLEGEAWSIPPEPRPVQRQRARPPRDIEQLRDGIVEAAQTAQLATPRRPWLDALPETIDLDRLRALAGATPSESADAALIGLRDEPANQVQRPVAIDLEDSGNVAFIGASGTGKTTALLTLASSLSAGAEVAPVQLYAIDAAGGALDTLAVLPTVGAVAPLSDTELMTRVLRHLLDRIAERGTRFAAARSSGLRAYRRTLDGANEPRVVLLLDGFAAFRQATETIGGLQSPLQMLGEIMSAGRTVGVHVVLSSDRPGAIPAALSSAVQQQYVFRLASPLDYGQTGVNADTLEQAPNGRAVLAGAGAEIQIAQLSAESGLSAQAAALERLAEHLRERNVPVAVPVANAPETVPLAELSVDAGGRPAYGINTESFDPVGLPAHGLGVIAGPPGSGVSAAARTSVRALTRWAAAQGELVDRVLLTFSEDGLGSDGDWEEVVVGEERVRDRARSLVQALGGKPASGGSAAAGLIGGLIGGPIGGPATPPIGGQIGSAAGTPAPDLPVFPAPGRRGVIVVERPADAEGTVALPELIALAKAARRSRVLVLFEFEQGTGSAIWDLFTALKQPNWGLALQPDASEGQSPFRETFGRVKRADFPPGRGFSVASGRVTPVHVALSE